MATGFASALSEGQPAQLDLGEEAVPCVVVGFSGADVVLAPGGVIPEDALGPLNTSYLLIEAGGTLHALKAHVREGLSDGELVATLLDPFRLQRRNFSRAPLVLPARLRPLGSEDPPATTFTRDISAGGLRVARQTSYQEADVHDIVLGLVGANREITGHGRNGARDRQGRLAQLRRDRSRGPADPGAVDLRVSPPKRRAVAHSQRRGI